MNLVTAATRIGILAFVALSLCGPGAGETADAHLGKGYDALKLERYEEAVREFRAALRIDPKLVMRAQFPLGVALFEMKQTAEARREFEAVRRAAGDQPNVAYYLGRLDLMDQNYAAAVRNFTKAMTRPPFPDTAYYLGQACFKQGDLAGAEKWLREAAGANPRDPLAPYQLGLVYRKLGREADAKEAFAQSAELRQRDTGESALRTECAQKLDSGPRDEARALCQRLYDPDDATRLAKLGTIYGEHGDLEDALPALRRAAELEPQAPQMQYNLAYTYFRMGRFAEARTPIAKAVERWPDIFQLNALYGAVLARLGEDDAAHEVLLRAHQQNSQDQGTSTLLYGIAMRLARANLAADRKADAVRFFQEAAGLRPNDPEAQAGLAAARQK
jgi:Flp pilus assembly protein TadD